MSRELRLLSNLFCPLNDECEQFSDWPTGHNVPWFLSWQFKNKICGSKFILLAPCKWVMLHVSLLCCSILKSIVMVFYTKFVLLLCCVLCDVTRDLGWCITQNIPTKPLDEIGNSLATVCQLIIAKHWHCGVMCSRFYLLCSLLAGPCSNIPVWSIDFYLRSLLEKSIIIAAVVCFTVPYLLSKRRGAR